MGSYNSKYKEYKNKSVGSMSIKLPEVSYFPGEQIKGTICIELQQDIPVYGLDLELTMAEGWKYVNDKNETKYMLNQQPTNQLSIDLQHKITEYNGEFYIQKGIHYMPFSMIVPDYAYPSFHFIGLNSTQLYMKYSFYSIIHTKDQKFNLSTSLDVVIKAPFKSLQAPLNVSSVKNVRAFLFFDKGTTILSATIPKNVFLFGEPVEINIEIDNSRGKQTIREIKVKLIQKVSGKDANGTEVLNYENIISDKSIFLEIGPNRIENISKHLQILNENINPNLYKESLSKIYSNIVNYSAAVMEIQPSIETTFIKCEYFIRISLHYDTFISYDFRPRIVLPIWIAHSLIDLYFESGSLPIQEKILVNMDNSNNMINNFHAPLENNQFYPPLYENPNANYHPIPDEENRGNEFNLIGNNHENFEDINSLNYPLMNHLLKK